MSSRPTTPTDDNRTVKVPLDTSVSTSTSQGSQTPATGLQGNMLATARYPTYTLYSQPSRHPTYDTRHEAQTATNVSQPLYAPPRSSLQSSSALGAAQPASVALSSEDTQYHGAVPATTEVELPKRTSSRLRRSSATVEESTGQSSTEAGPVVDETAPAPRKKRTRTLTTAHQSSVLLSLLAKTPFPTTAEREHVGRQIGLTARKVQVWFQNQRQKQKKSSQTGNLATSDQAATTSAPLPLARQPGFSALHAARMGVVASPSNPTHLSGSQFSGGTSVGITGYGHSVGPPTGPYREQVTMPYTSVYSRSFAEQTPYYHPQPGATVGNESYLQQSVATSSPPRPRTSHSHITPSPYAPAGSYSETLHTPQTVSAGMTGSSYGHASHPSTSQGTTSDDHSLPPASETGLHYTSSPSEAWRYKPLPPLPTAPSPRDRSLNWEHQSAQHEFRPPPVPPSRSRAFSNPDSRSSEQEPGGHFTHVRGSSSTLPPPSSYGLTRFAPAASVLPVESTAPSSYHGHSEYRAEDVSSVNTGGEGHYNVRYGETHTSPGTASPTSSLSYAEGVALGIGQSQHGRTTYSPIDRRRNRLSYDSSLAARSQLGKRSWSSEDERASKRPRTDDGHITVPLGPSPLSFPSAHGASAHPPISYQPPTSSSASLSSVMSQSTLGIHMPSPSTPAGQPENLNTRYYSSNDP